VVNADARRMLRLRSDAVRAVREYLTGRGYLEVETPMLQPVHGGANARPFITHINAYDMRLYLRIAPELYLKRLLVGGIERVYEINRNFRNEGISTQHNPEFTMLEFYQAYSDMAELMDMTEEMLSAVTSLVTGGHEATFGDERISFKPPYKRLAMREAVCEEASRRLGRQVDESECRDQEAARALAADLGVGVDPNMGPGRMTAEVFEALWESSLVQPTFVYDFPTEVSPLSKQKPGDPDTVERFELYAGRFELANAFSELNDPAEQRRRFEQQLLERQKGDVEAHEMDEDYVRALEYGMPPAGGEGVGIDRLVMILTNSVSIRDVILFPLMRPRKE